MLMKTRYMIGIFAVFLLLALSGCSGKGEVVAPEEESDEDFGGGETEAAEDSEELTDGEKELTNKELLKKLQEEAGLDSGEDDSESADETEDTTESVLEVKEVTIQNFKGTPDDFTIEVGTTVRWTNFMNNFKQLIVILPWDDDKGKYDFKEINDMKQILYNESYEYTFEEAGDFRWGSKTKFDKINGEIKVK